VFTNSD